MNWRDKWIEFQKWRQTTLGISSEHGTFFCHFTIVLFQHFTLIGSCMLFLLFSQIYIRMISYGSEWQYICLRLRSHCQFLGLRTAFSLQVWVSMSRSHSSLQLSLEYYLYERATGVKPVFLASNHRDSNQSQSILLLCERDVTFHC